MSLSSRRLHRKRKKAIRQGRINARPREHYTVQEIGDRDNWICGICQDPIDPELKWPDKMSKSKDHILSIAKGGADVKANVQIAHFLCNSQKGSK